jgi:hypothetical protein
MLFNSLRTGDFVKWSERLLKHPNRGDVNESWLWEQDGCILEVTRVNARGEEASIELQCVNDCARHTVLSLDESEYNELFSLINSDPMSRVESFDYLMDEMFAQEKAAVFDVLEESDAIFTSLLEGKPI